MSRRRKKAPSPAEPPPTSWEGAIHALIEEDGREIGRALALRTGLLLLLRAPVATAASPADLSAAEERAFLASLPESLRPAGRETVRVLHAFVPPARRRARRRRGR